MISGDTTNESLPRRYSDTNTIVVVTDRPRDSSSVNHVPGEPFTITVAPRSTVSKPIASGDAVTAVFKRQCCLFRHSVLNVNRIANDRVSRKKLEKKTPLPRYTNHYSIVERAAAFSDKLFANIRLRRQTVPLTNDSSSGTSAINAATIDTTTTTTAKPTVTEFPQSGQQMTTHDPSMEAGKGFFILCTSLEVDSFGVIAGLHTFLPNMTSYPRLTNPAVVL